MIVWSDKGTNRRSPELIRPNMDEDEAYRASSQYRLWSFTAAQLEECRIETNRMGAEKVRAAFARKHAAQEEDTSSSEAKVDPESIDTLTVKEEQVIVQWGCSKLIELRSYLDPPPTSTVIVSWYLTNITLQSHYLNNHLESDTNQEFKRPQHANTSVAFT